MFTVNFKKKNIYNLTLKLSVVVIIFYLVFRKIDLNEVLKLLNLSKEIIFINILITIILFFLSSWRLNLLYLGKIKFNTFFWSKLHGYSSLLNLIIPGKMGDLIKYYLIKKKNKKYPKSYLIGMFIAERSIDLLIIIFYFFLCSGLVNKNPTDFFIILFIAIFSLFLIKKKFPSRIKVKKINFFKNIQLRLLKFIFHFNLYKKKLFLNKNIVYIFFITLFFWFLSLLQINILIDFYADGLDFLSNSVIIIKIILISLIPISISGLGVREYSFIFFFGSIIGNNEAFVISVYFYLFRYLLPGIIGLGILIFNKR